MSDGYHLSGDALATRLNLATDRTGMNPLLTALAMSGTMAAGYRLQPTSPALNAGTCSDHLGAIVSADQ